MPETGYDCDVLIAGAGPSGLVLGLTPSPQRIINGRGVGGIYPWEVAETKVDALLRRGREAGHPLQAAIEDA